MSDHADQDETALIEKLFSFAETRVNLTDCSAESLPDAEVSERSSTNEHLVLVAQHELERHHLRKRHLPAEICTDLGWRMLLDLFVCDQLMIKIPTQGSNKRWGVSATTAVRQMAALIETGLACRMMSDVGVDRSYLILTAKGREELGRVLVSYP